MGTMKRSDVQMTVETRAMDARATVVHKKLFAFFHPYCSPRIVPISCCICSQGPYACTLEL